MPLLFSSEYPLLIVDHINFRRYTASLQPLFQDPCRNIIKKGDTQSVQFGEIINFEVRKS